MQNKVVEYMANVRDTAGELDRLLTPQKYTRDLRTVVTFGLLSTAIQHGRSVLQLITSGSNRSAAALTRSIVDCAYFGLWVNCCASTEKLRSLEKDEARINMVEVVKAVDGACRSNRFYQVVKSECVASFYKTNRAGIFQLGQWALGISPGLRPSSQELCDIMKAGVASILLLTHDFLVAQKRTEEAERVRALAGEYINLK